MDSKSDPKALFDGILTDEEIQGLLSRFDEDHRQGPDAVLLLTDSAEEEERICAYLESGGISAIAARDAAAALEVLRKKRCRVYVAAVGALPSPLDRYLERLREVDLQIPFVILRDPGDPPLPPVRAATIERPLSEDVLDRLFPFARSVPTAASALEANAEKPSIRRDTTERGGADLAAGLSETDRPSPDPTRRSDALLAVQALLEAGIAGEGLAGGLRRWAESDPTIRGVVEVEEDPEEWRLRARARERRERRRMVLLLLEQLAAANQRVREPRTLGEFSLFPHAKGSGLALWHKDEADARQTLERLRRIFPLIVRLEEKGQDDPAPRARDRFIALVESRIRAAERRKGRLGLLLLETAPGESPVAISHAVGHVLRGSDWVEVVGNRVYVILDEPTEDVLRALDTRLKESPEIDRRRMVVVGWDPSKGRAAEFVAMAEGILHKEPSGGG
jgi:hypothetical protein